MPHFSSTLRAVPALSLAFLVVACAPDTRPDAAGGRDPAAPAPVAPAPEAGAPATASPAGPAGAADAGTEEAAALEKARDASFLDPDPAARARAVRYLAEHDLKNVHRHAVVDALKDLDPGVRRAAAVAMKERDLVYAYQRLTYLLSDEDAETARLAMETLRALTTKFIRDPAWFETVAYHLVRAVADDGRRDTPFAADLLALVRSEVGGAVAAGDPAILDKMKAPLRVMVEQSRAVADDAQGYDKEMIAVLDPIIADAVGKLTRPGASVAARAAVPRAMSAAEPGKGDARLMKVFGAPLSAALHDESAEVRLAAVWVFHYLKDDATLAALKDDPDPAVRERVKKSLAEIAADQPDGTRSKKK
ncbi:MAG: HEAT repeat domain-containing protein [Planctomycetes bacterium]|nr:HEAT repeat domain-containing protein [Planctomycetota bacterium]